MAKTRSTESPVDLDARTLAAEWPASRPTYTSLTAATLAESGRWNVPGMAVAILNHASIETASAGVTSVVTRQPVTDDTIFQIGSISKIFTATLVMQLVEEGLIDLDEPVLTYVPDLPLADANARTSVTMRHLLSHTSGFEGDRFIDYGRGDDALATSIANFDTLRQWTRPGDLFSYCNAGFYLAGRVIENVCKAPFETVIAEKLIDPLGLKTTVFFADEAIGLPHAVGHHLERREDGNRLAAGYSMPRNVNAAGGIVASTRELLRFAAMHVNDGEIDGVRLLSAASAQAMREPRIEAGPNRGHYGIGWAIGEFEPFRVVSHGGATRGFRAQLTVVPERAFAIALLSNGESGSLAMAEVESWALETYLGFKRPELDRVELSGGKLDDLTGTYLRHDRRTEISRDGDTLKVEIQDLDEETGKEDGDLHTSLLEPVGNRLLRYLQGPGRGMIAEVIDCPAADGTERRFLRSSGRLSAWVEPDAGPKSRPKCSAGRAKSGKTRG